MLRVLDKLWGEANLLDELPGAPVYQDAIYVPFDPGHYIAHDPTWGLFDAVGKPIEAGLYRRGGFGGVERVSGGTGFDGSPMSSADPTFDYVYLGPVMQHYGHFITATLARCWHPYLHPSPSTRYILHCEVPIETLFSYPYAAQSFARLGLNPTNVVRFTESTHLGRVLVPEPAFEEQHYVRSIFGQMCRYIGADVPTNDASDVPIYLSKLRLPAGVGRFRNESAFVAQLEHMGFKICFPETLTLREQIALFNVHRFVVGAGSGLHTALFSARSPLIIALALNESVNSNFTLIDLAARTRTLHLFPGEGTRWNHHPDQFPSFLAYMRGQAQVVESLGHEQGFMSDAEIPDPAQFAIEIADLLRDRGALI
ncbi:glycosyltransferase family 61 protein [Methylobacterium fujisawaense]|uniref:glycosyltransferase family 61 protein n=1 Tax=Methylobacterium fujisawaense TaxID=107400 RepID=UPI000DB17B5F